MPANRIGVYVCHCGTNIAGTVDCEAVRDFAAKLPGVVVSRDYKYMCSEPGQEIIKKDIKEENLDGVVVASCSPRMHEPTFQKAVAQAGLNSYMMEMANIREQCSWVTEDRDEATEKAKDLVASAVAKVRMNAPLEATYNDITPRALVVGGGVAGIEAALRVADSGYEVVLVEKEASIGGKMAKFDKTFPTLDCAACILTPKMVEVAQHPNIKLMTYSEVEKVDGFVGNFEVTIRQKARDVDLEDCTGCGICSEKCPGKAASEFDEGLSQRGAIYIPFAQAIPNVAVIDRENCLYYNGKAKCQVCAKLCPSDAISFDNEDVLVKETFGAIVVATGFQSFRPEEGNQWGFGKYPDVISGLQFERLTNASGPTDGKVKTSKGEVPKAVAIVHCVGSRDANQAEYCSRICCMASLKFAHLVKEKCKDAEVFEFYIDMRAFGKGYEEFYNRIQEEGVHFIRGKSAEVSCQIEDEGERLVLRGEDTLLGVVREIPVDMVILNTALLPQADAPKVAETFGLQQGEDGFFMELHAKLAPTKTPVDGVFLAGTCQAPRDIPDSVAHAGGAASEAQQLIASGKVKMSPVAAYNEEEKCSGCKICIALCPYDAIEFDEDKGVAVFNQALCKGCGTCVASCPTKAAGIKHFEDEQIFAQIEGVCASS